MVDHVRIIIIFKNCAHFNIYGKLFHNRKIQPEKEEGRKEGKVRKNVGSRNLGKEQGYLKVGRNRGRMYRM